MESPAPTAAAEAVPPAPRATTATCGTPPSAAAATDIVARAEEEDETELQVEVTATYRATMVVADLGWVDSIWNVLPFYLGSKQL